MIPAQLLSEIDDEAKNHKEGIEKLDGIIGPTAPELIAYFKFRAGAEWLFTRLCEMSEVEFDWQRVKREMIEAGVEKYQSADAAVAGARHQHALDKAALLKAKEEVAQLNIRVKALDKTDEHYANLMIKHRDEANERFYQERARCERYEKALKDIIWSWDNDAGRACYELARQALSGEKE